MITPTVGRVVWFYPGDKDQCVRHGNGPLAATIAHVWGDRMVNIGYLDSNGVHRIRTSVRLVQPEDSQVIDDASIGFCMWMPYQVGQAKKHEDPINTSGPAFDPEKIKAAFGGGAPPVTTAEHDAVDYAIDVVDEAMATLGRAVWADITSQNVI